MQKHFIKLILFSALNIPCLGHTDTILTYNATAEQFAQLLLKYQVTDEFIKLGDVYLNNSNLGLKIESPNQLSIFWPSEVFRNGQLELIKNNGDVIFTQSISEDSLQTYAIATNENLRNSYHSVRVTVPIQEAWLNAIKVSGGVFFCLKNKSSTRELEICSSPHRLTKENFVLSSKNSSTKVLLNDSESRPLEGEIPLDPIAVSTTRWFAQLQSGLSWSFKEASPKWKIIEIVEVDSKLYRISGIGPRPLKYFTDHFTYKNRPFFHEYKPKALMSENDDFWSVNIQSDNSMDLSFINPNGGIYTARINVSNAPKLLQSPIIIGSSKAQLTYSGQNTFVVSVSPEAKVMRKANVVPNMNGTRFKWKLTDLKKGKITSNSIITKTVDRAEKSYFLETYRGYPLDVGFQYTLNIVSGDSTAQIGQIHVSYWADDFWGLGNYDWLRLRLGFQIKHFKPPKKVSISVESSENVKKEVELASSVFDIKYRFQPGLWGRDETFGFMMAQHQFTFDEYKLGLLGAGLFWARSMPKFFDDLFNLIPIFRYPKWVNAELINFFYNSNANLKLKSTYHLNFYGKVHWTEVFYGDLGFGLQSYSFSDRKSDRSPLLDLFFVNIGVGFVY